MSWGGDSSWAGGWDDPGKGKGYSKGKGKSKSPAYPPQRQSVAAAFETLQAAMREQYALQALFGLVQPAQPAGVGAPWGQDWAPATSWHAPPLAAPAWQPQGPPQRAENGQQAPAFLSALAGGIAHFGVAAGGAAVSLVASAVKAAVARRSAGDASAPPSGRDDDSYLTQAVEAALGATAQQSREDDVQTQLRRMAMQMAELQAENARLRRKAARGADDEDEGEQAPPPPPDSPQDWPLGRACWRDARVDRRGCRAGARAGLEAGPDGRCAGRGLGRRVHDAGQCGASPAEAGQVRAPARRQHRPRGRPRYRLAGAQQEVLGLAWVQFEP